MKELIREIGKKVKSQQMTWREASEINKKEYGELFAFKVKNADKFKQCVSYIRNEVIAGRNRGGGWEYEHSNLLS